MIILEEIKALLVNLNWKDLRTLSKIKKRIKKGPKEIKIENVDLAELNDKSLINEYLISLLKKYPNFPLNFVNCNIDGINLQLDNQTTMTFNKCFITNLSLKSSNDTNTANFNNCKFLYCDTEKNDICIKTSKVNMNDCIIDIKTNANHILELGNGISSVNIKNQSFRNYNNVPFNIYICTKFLSLFKYNSIENIKLVVSRGNKNIDYINILNSNAVFNENAKIDVKMILADNSTIHNLSTESESIEISNNCIFESSNIKTDDLIINGDAIFKINNTDLNINYLECSENSEINDTTNKFNWIKKVGKISANKDFKLRYNNELIYTKENNQNIDDYHFEDVIENVEEKIRKMR